MVTVFRSGQMEQSTKVVGAKTWQMVVESFGTQTVTYLMESGSKTEHTASALTLMWMGPSTRVSGKRTCSTVTALKSGKTEVLMKVSMRGASAMAKANKTGVMAVDTKETGTATK